MKNFTNGNKDAKTGPRKTAQKEKNRAREGNEGGSLRRGDREPINPRGICYPEKRERMWGGNQPRGRRCT